MKKFFIILLFVFLSGCLKNEVSISVNDLDSIETINKNNRTYYLVDKDNLVKAATLNSLTYDGTEDEYHFMRIWLKAEPKDRIIFFAVHNNVCSVCNPATILEEEDNVKRTHIWRVVNVQKNKCVVECREN